jgi:hypothetical protein
LLTGGVRACVGDVVGGLCVGAVLLLLSCGGVPVKKKEWRSEAPVVWCACEVSLAQEDKRRGREESRQAVPSPDVAVYAGCCGWLVVPLSLGLTVLSGVQEMCLDLLRRVVPNLPAAFLPLSS